MMGLENPKLHTKSEVATFSRCKNIKGELQNFWEVPNTGPCPLFFCVGFCDGFGNPQRLAKFEVAGFIYYGNIR